MRYFAYHTVDKAGWGPGPWQSEPDKMQGPGLPCLIVRNSLGALCGYAGVSPGHPAYGLHYDGITQEQAAARSARWRASFARASELDAQGKNPLEAYGEGGVEIEPTAIGEKVSAIQVHGGLTFAGGCQEGADPSKHICHLPEEGEPDTVWWFGFDCGHSGDYLPGYVSLLTHRDRGEAYRDIPYVKAECADLAKQLHDMTPQLPAPE